MGFPGGSVVKNLPDNAEYNGLIPVQEDSTWHEATKSVSHKYWAPALEPKSRNYGSPSASAPMHH